MATELDALQLNITSSTSNAISSIDKLIKSLNNLGSSIGTVNATGFVSTLNGISSSLNALGNATKQVNSATMKDIAAGMRVLSNAMKNMDNGVNSMNALNNVANGLMSISNLTGRTDFSAITSLIKSLNKLDSAKLTAASKSLFDVGYELNRFSTIAVPEGLIKLITSLRSLGSKSISNAIQNLPKLLSALQQFQGLGAISVPDGLDDLAKSLSLFGRKNMQAAASNLPLFTQNMGSLLSTLANSPQISSNVTQLTTALANLVNGLRGTNTNSRGASKGLDIFSLSARRTTKSSFSLASAIGKIYATYFLLFRAFGKIKESIEIASSLKEVQNVVDTTFEDMAYKVEEFAETSIESFGMSELSAKQYASRFQAMGVAMEISASSIEKAQEKLNQINPVLASRGYNDTANSMADLSINLTKLTADMASFYNVAQEDVAKDLESIFTGSTRPLRAYGLDITNATLQEWALNHGIEANVKTMSQAEKTLLRYQYVLANTSAAQGDFAKTSFTWANQIRILSQNFERLGRVIGEGFIAWLRPAIVMINSYMDAIISAVQRVVNALGQIFGWQMIVDKTGDSIIEDTEDLADAYDDATGAAKKFKQQLLGIDELNNLTTNDSGSGAGTALGNVGGAGSNIIDTGGIDFVPIESDIKTLYQLGEKMSEGFRNLLPDDWTPIYEKARGFGTGLADFLNGLITPETFYKVGKSIAGVLNTIAESIKSFFLEADWKKYKDSFLAGLEGFADEIDLGTIKIAIGAIVISKVGKWIFGGGAIQTLATAFSSIGSVASVQSGIISLFAGITNSSIVAAGAVALFAGGLAAVFATNEDVRKSFAEAATSLKDGIVDVLTTLKDTILPGIIDELKKLWENLSPSIDALEKFFTDVWQSNINPSLSALGDTILPKISDMLDKLWKNILQPITDIALTKLSNKLNFLTEIGTKFYEKVIKPALGEYGELILVLFNDFSKDITSLTEKIGWFIDKNDELWNTWLKPIADWVKNDFMEMIENAFATIGGVLSGFLETVKGVIEIVHGLFTDDWAEMWVGATDVVKGFANTAISLIEGFLNGFINGANDLIRGLNLIGKSEVAKKTGMSFEIKEISKLEIPRFESGGYPTQGSLFVAGETYGQSEWVGNINGRTGVASGAEITGIADAIYSTSYQEMELLRQQNDYLIGILNKEFGITRNQIGREAQAYAKEYQARTGKIAYQS